MRAYGGRVEVGEVEDDELELLVVVDETLELAIEDDEVEDIELEVLELLVVVDATLELAMEDDEVEDIELEVLELLELLEDVDEIEVVEAAVLMQEQPLETLEGSPEHAVATQGGRVTDVVAVV